MDTLILNLYKINCIKIGTFTLVNGKKTNLNIEFSNLYSYPSYHNIIIYNLWNILNKLDSNLIINGNNNSISLVSILSVNHNIPMIFIDNNKDFKKRKFKGLFDNNNSSTLIYDYIDNKTNIRQIVNHLSLKGININNILTICDKRTIFSNNNCNIYSLFNLNEILDILYKNNILEYSKYIEIKNENYPKIKKQLTFEFRSKLTNNILCKKIFELMEKKKTNLCFSADIIDMNIINSLLEKIGDHIIICKIHCDIINNFTKNNIKRLMQLAKSKEFLIFEDGNFIDIGNIFLNKLCNGYNINSWADIISCHCFAGDGILSTFNKINQEKKKGIILVNDFSSDTNNNDNYSEIINSYIDKYRNDVIGVITKRRTRNDDNILYFTSGIHLDISKDNLDQKYRKPDMAIINDNCDILIVGRGIYESKDPVKTAEIYKFLSWNAYQNKIK